ncbi:DegT/DnrJ/EryC1/StrS family aminotransferase [Cellulomonas aerilata]|uniref:Pyridoxal phosphate-dependent aminotransferase EpsN n=1 Tax=Cellulomonas aerilata TaxID=515326 RepID=A0A512DCB4_9CELL|nr:aminotransferase class I/II-fold pyridoxal phosphate-dependent enzyme [Cellulomonas aerilata]GEO34118.1 hypothetical protein CAE01nite_18430 [Cellulomonas aerilata]
MGAPGAILLSPPEVGEAERTMLLAALESGWVAPAGPDLDAFEHEVAAVVGAEHAVALSSGTAALHLGLLLAGVGPGDEVLVPSFTFAATANVVAYLGATPVFVDCSPSTWTLDTALVAERLRAGAGRCRAVIAVDIYGQCADYDALVPLCEEAGVELVEDAAEALGSTYRGRAAGVFGRSAALSFNGNKIITAGGGGMLLTPDAALAARARHLATQAREPVAHYEHRDIGYNYRLSNLLAAVGRAQLLSLHAKVDRRRAHRAAYRAAFADTPGLQLMPLADHGRSNCWLTCVLVEPDEFGATAEQVRLHLQSCSIEARATWKPMHLQPVFAGAQVVGGAVCEDLFARGLALPSGSGMTDLERDRVIEAVLATPRRAPARRPLRAVR